MPKVIPAAPRRRSVAHLDCHRSYLQCQDRLDVPLDKVIFTWPLERLAISITRLFVPFKYHVLVGYWDLERRSLVLSDQLIGLLILLLQKLLQLIIEFLLFFIYLSTDFELLFTHDAQEL